MKNGLFTLLFLFMAIPGFAQEENYTSEEIKVNSFIEGTLLSPKSIDKPPLVIMVQGSGPTDRNGNQSFMQNNALKKLAQELVNNNIASFRFDKRILKMAQNNLKEEDIRFDDFVTDVNAVLDHFEELQEYDKIILLGHSQGSLVSFLAGNSRTDAMISIAGAAKPIDSIIIDQIAFQMPSLKENVEQSFKELKETGSSQSYNPLLASIFRPSVQPFILSWMQYQPKKEVARLDMPLLIINGTKDLQVMPSEAEALKAANPEAKLVLLDNMNHVLRKIEGDQLENSKSYNEPNLPLHPEIVPVITAFIESLQ